MNTVQQTKLDVIKFTRAVSKYQTPLISKAFIEFCKIIKEEISKDRDIDLPKFGKLYSCYGTSEFDGASQHNNYYRFIPSTTLSYSAMEYIAHGDKKNEGIDPALLTQEEGSDSTGDS